MTITSVAAGGDVDPAWGNSVASAINGHESAWTAYTPTPIGFTVGVGSITARYKSIGKTTFYLGTVLFGGGATVPGDFGLSLPVFAATAVNAIGVLDMLDSGTGYEVGTCLVTSSSTMELHHARGLASNAGRVNATNPYTFVPGDIIRWNITYEAS